MPRFFDVASRIVRPINSTWLLKKKKKKRERGIGRRLKYAATRSVPDVRPSILFLKLSVDHPENRFNDEMF